jgi:NAD(P)H dehydrogenase (quinone)
VPSYVRSMHGRKHYVPSALRSLSVTVATIAVLSMPSTALKLLISATPVAAGISEAAGFFAAAGREQGLKRIVDLSLATTRVDSPSPQGRAQRVAEQIFEWAGFGGVHLRIAAFFMENVLLLDAENIRLRGRIANSFGDKALSWISGQDVGAMAAGLLIDDAHVTERILIAGGVERLTYSEVAETIAAAVGKAVRYDELTPDEWRHELTLAANAKDGEVNLRGIDHLVAQSVALRAGPSLPVTGHVRQLTGQDPITFAAFAQRHREELAPGASGVPGFLLNTSAAACRS